MKFKQMLRKMIYNAAWWVIKRIDTEAKEPGDFFRWQNMIFFIDEFEVEKSLHAPAKATLTLTEYNLRDIFNPKSYTKGRQEALKS